MDERANRPPPDAAETTALDAAVAQAARFLRECLRSGAYGLACTGSDGTPRFSDNKGHVFVASFIAEAMSGLFDEIDRTIVLVRILSEENGGSWGFSPPGAYHRDEFRVFHVDSDDTAYVIRTLRRLGVNRPPDALLRFRREPEGLFVTFDAPGPTSLTTEPSPRHNLLAHPEVNANVFLALQGTHFERFVDYGMLARAQDERGFWRSYFYPSPLFGTLLALDVLRAQPAFAGATARSLAFVAGSQNADGSWGAGGDPHETALAVAALAGRGSHASAMQRGVDYLLSTMAEDGSWSSRACVWEFHADERDVWRAYDTHRAYVTARCTAALRRAAGRVSAP
ncbi:MAG TPA: prenyltransferase/squalene oxidase repeat-containing protein [Candidatus Elarobacter sp.]|nr:prenyltransferase/squalene oxidase repeat-containing protein [Candidatus Elarobacter sp.]